MHKILDQNFFTQPTLIVARELVGKFLMRKINWKVFSYQIIEVEAYLGEADQASHASKGRTGRTEIMFGEAAHIYVYLIYGMHYMLNIVTEEKETAGAVLIRSVLDMENGTIISGPGRVTKLLDSGEGSKLERYGEMVLVRPDPQALWARSLSSEIWNNAHAVFMHEGSRGKWDIKKNNQESLFENWQVQLSDVTCTLKLSPFKHVGVFPEQSVHWTWLTETIKKNLEKSTIQKKKVSVLNLFGYTGGASIAGAIAGATVTHVDASESTVAWSKINRTASGLSDDAIRFIVDDARKFVEREIRRGNTYEIIILDPPIYGRGAKNELWKIENDLVPLLSKIKKLLSKDPVAILLNGYAAGYSHIAYAQALATAVTGLLGSITSGELAIEESSPSKRLLPCGIFAKWVREA